MKKLISLSLWGNNPTYNIGCVRFAEQAREIFPDWDVRVYAASDIRNGIREKLIQVGCNVVDMPESNSWAGLFWRYYAIEENAYDYTIFRDADCRPTLQEKKEVDKWIESGKGMHTIHAHPYHFTVPILGGLFGMRKGICPEFIPLLKKWDLQLEYQNDQEFLTTSIYPIVMNDIYRSNMLLMPPNDDYSFIGEQMSIDDTPLNPQHRIIAKAQYDLQTATKQ